MFQILGEIRGIFSGWSAVLIAYKRLRQSSHLTNWEPRRSQDVIWREDMGEERKKMTNINEIRTDGHLMNITYVLGTFKTIL